MARLPGDVEVIACTKEQEPILANLLELYIYDFSELLALELGPDGRFGYPSLPLYWSEPGWHAFLAKDEKRWIGFALVNRGSDSSGAPDVWDMAEFFILRNQRRYGLGTQVAHEVWRRFPGAWQIRVMDENRSALRFWECAITQFLGETVAAVPLEKDGKRWRVFSFVVTLS